MNRFLRLSSTSQICTSRTTIRGIITLADHNLDSSVHEEVDLEEPPVQHLYGANAVRAALTAKRRSITRLYTYSDGKTPSNLQDMARKAGIDILETDNKGVLNNFSGNRPHNGYVLECSSLPEITVSSLGTASQRWLPILQNLDKMQNQQDLARVRNSTDGKPIYLLLDEITDPQNIGSIIRTAYFMGVTGLVMSSRNCASLSPLVAKVSSGATEFLPIFLTPSTVSFIRSSQRNGWTCLATVSPQEPLGNKKVSLHELASLHHEAPLLLVLGSEGDGLRTLVKRECGGLVSIPAGQRVHASVDSLNVGVAVGVLLASMARTETFTGTEKLDPGRQLP